MARLPTEKPQLDREEKVATWCVYHLCSLKKKGLVDGGYDMTEKGEEYAKELVDSGFRPTQEEMESCLRFLTSRGGK